MSILSVYKGIQNSYDILETFEAGLVLTGPEVKSAKSKHMQLQASYVSLYKGELWLKNAKIAAYPPSQRLGIQHDALRDKKILIKRSEINRLQGKMQEKGLTLIPLKVYTTRGLIKVEVALAKGKNTHDKRQAIKKKELQKTVLRAYKQEYD